MNIIEAFETAKNGKLVRHPNLPFYLYGYKTMDSKGVLYEIGMNKALIITEDLLDNWEKVTNRDIIEDVKNNNI